MMGLSLQGVEKANDEVFVLAKTFLKVTSAFGSRYFFAMFLYFVSAQEHSAPNEKHVYDTISSGRFQQGNRQNVMLSAYGI